MIAFLATSTKLNEYQIKQQNDIFKNNPSLKSDFQIGWYSNGDAVIDVFWDFKPENIYKITLFMNPKK
jgi:hypothetical protein